jgi:hypothetical protein
MKQNLVEHRRVHTSHEHKRRTKGGHRPTAITIAQWTMLLPGFVFPIQITRMSSKNVFDGNRQLQ